MKSHVPLPSITEQAEKLIDLGVPELLGQAPDCVRRSSLALERAVGNNNADVLLVPSQISCSYDDLVRLVRHHDKPGFVVVDFTDAADFIPVAGPDSKTVDLPDSPWYLLFNPERGDELHNVSPAEASAIISSDGRVPLTLAEGIFLLLQSPELLEKNNCFMTIGSRKQAVKGRFDSHTPALWISNGTGRDGAGNRGAPKLGWCWWNNRHSWLGIAHAKNRRSVI